MAYTESACTKCPRNCRAGVWLTYKKAATGCVSGDGADFRVTEYVAEDVEPTQTLAEPVTEVPDGVTMLLGCQTCRAPCLLEITGPANVQGHCVLGIDRKPDWHRVTS